MAMILPTLDLTSLCRKTATRIVGRDYVQDREREKHAVVKHSAGAWCISNDSPACAGSTYEVKELVWSDSFLSVFLTFRIHLCHQSFEDEQRGEPTDPPPSGDFCQSDLNVAFHRIIPNDRRHNPVLSKGLPPLLQLVTCSCSMPEANGSCRALIGKDGTTLQLYSQGMYQRSSTSLCVSIA